MFAFKVEGINNINNDDIEITEADWQVALSVQSEGNSLRIKENIIYNKDNITPVFNVLEVYTPEIIIPEEIIKTELELKVEVLENENADLLLDSVMKDMRIEQNEFDISDLLLTMGGM